MFSQSLLDILLLAGAIAWLTTVTVKKDGPNLILRRTRYQLDRWLGGQERNPFNCFTCACFWVTLVVITVWVQNVQAFNDVIRLFGLMGLALAVRGLSGEWA